MMYHPHLLPVNQLHGHSQAIYYQQAGNNSPPFYQQCHTGVQWVPVQQQPQPMMPYQMMSPSGIMMAPTTSSWNSSYASSTSFNTTSSSTTSSDNEDSLDGNNGFGLLASKKDQPQNFKTQICRHFQSKGLCPHGLRCQFAHGPHELRPSTSRSPPLQQKSQTMSYKIELCQSFKNGGPEKCKYGASCNFIHPSDGAAYIYKKAQETHGEECHRLYAQRDANKNDPAMVQIIEDQINNKVRQWNQTNPKKKNYYDLHGMTLSGADQYIFDKLSTSIVKDRNRLRELRTLNAQTLK